MHAARGVELYVPIQVGGCITTKRRHRESDSEHFKYERQLRWLQSMVSAEPTSEHLDSERQLGGWHLMVSSDYQSWRRIFEPIHGSCVFFTHIHASWVFRASKAVQH